MGKSLAQIELRRKYGVTLLAVRRDTQVLADPSGETIVCAEDVLMVLGRPEKIVELSRALLPQEQGRR